MSPVGASSPECVLCALEKRVEKRWPFFVEAICRADTSHLIGNFGYRALSCVTYWYIFDRVIAVTLFYKC